MDAVFPENRNFHARATLARRPSFARRAAHAAFAATMLVATGLAAAAAPTPGTAGPVLLAAAPADAAKARTGEIRADLLYHNYCSVCHGDRGDGRSRARGSLVPPPKDFTSAQAIAEMNRDRMIAFTASGKPGTAMVGWSTQLSHREIEAVVDYVMNTFMKPRTTPTFARGKTIYTQSCIVCHGEYGQGAATGAHGTVPPRNFAAPQARDLSAEQMVAAVTHGRPGTPMGAYAGQLSKEDIAAVVEYVRVSFMAASPSDASGTSAHRGRAGGAEAPITPAFPGATNGAAKAPPPGAATPASADMSLPFPNRLVGNAARGKKFYDANCATCHGVKGDAQGPRAYFIRPVPRNFLTAESRSTLNRPALFAGTSAGRLGSEMPAWSKVLTEQEIADVSEYVFQTFIDPRGATASAAAKAKK